MYLLRELCELIDDEEDRVKIEALSQLNNVLHNYSKSEIA